MEITLNEMEQALARAIAEMRIQSAADAGQRDANQSDLPSEVIDLEGAASEVAFCKLFNLYPDTQPGAKAVDAYTHLGIAIDVKSTHHPKGRLLAVRWKRPKDVELFVLMIGKFPTYRCVGFLPSADLLRNDRLVDLGRGPVYAANQDELHDPVRIFNARHITRG